MYSQFFAFFSVKWSVTFNTGSPLFLSSIFFFAFISCELAEHKKKFKRWRQTNRSNENSARCLLGDVFVCVGAVLFLCVFPLNWAYQFQCINAHFVCFDWNKHQNVIYSALCVCGHTFFTFQRMYAVHFHCTKHLWYVHFFYRLVLCDHRSNKTDCQFTFRGRKIRGIDNFGKFRVQ